MTDHVLTAKISILLEDEDPLVSDLILETIKQVETKPISIEAHAKNMQRYLDMKVEQKGDES
ncbi:hypothetical protein KQI49_03095 [Virgibacillus sp. MSJ-26]|uniref:hypothetical protein n=1 Tax=Virgibacillus sp. MSJ-26 TaxID=2841522 RepID=UPI001C1287A2|nr:hypothetical protein [Virgibacillus sp. MSJ-26]MBU5465813.1 hypothetical protein [Virgibacillus sp. MSJ-26]